MPKNIYNWDSVDPVDLDPQIYFLKFLLFTFTLKQNKNFIL